MAISNDIFKAILALDAYNRGYHAGIGDLQTGLAGTQIGNATLVLNSSALVDANGNRLDQASSFYAQSYTWNGGTIISYRGTDNAIC